MSNERSHRQGEPGTKQDTAPWIIAILLGGAALTGLVSVIVALILFLDVPRSLDVLAPLLLIALICAYVWTIGRALDGSWTSKRARHDYQQASGRPLPVRTSRERRSPDARLHRRGTTGRRLGASA